MSGGDLQRFTFFERLMHWVVGVSFVLLLLTGLAFSYPSLFWLTALFGGGPAARVLHPWTGIVLSAGLVVLAVLWVRDMVMRRADLEWLGALDHYLRHEREHLAATGKYNGGQKLFFWSALGLGVIFLVTGVPLWLPESFAPGLLRLCRLVHFLATLGGGLFLIAHIYLAVFAFPGTARAMLYGSVTRQWAKLHHLLWYREQVKHHGD